MSRPRRAGMPRPIGVGPFAARTLAAGEAIFREGDDARGEAFLIQAGMVEISKRTASGTRRLRVLAAGELVGELALFRGTPHSASAIALEATTLLVIPADRLDDLVRRHPGLAVALIRQLAVRLREAEERDGAP